jgi:Bacterial SH3 domain
MIFRTIMAWLVWLNGLQLALAAPQQPTDTTVCSFINSNKVNMRKTADPKAPIVAVLNRGDGVAAKGKVGTWVEITAKYLDDQNTRSTPLHGYVSNQYINGCSEDQFDHWRQ